MIKEFAVSAIVRFELSSHYKSNWQPFWHISYRKDTLLRGVPNSCWVQGGTEPATLDYRNDGETLRSLFLIENYHN